MATKFRVEVASGKKWIAEISHDSKDDAIAVAEYVSEKRSVQTRVTKVSTKTVWQSKKVTPITS